MRERSQSPINRLSTDRPLFDDELANRDKGRSAERAPEKQLDFADHEVVKPIEFRKIETCSANGDKEDWQPAESFESIPEEVGERKMPKH